MGLTSPAEYCYNCAREKQIPIFYLLKDTRDRTFETESHGVTVNRTQAIAWLGSAFLNNEENYLFQKFCRATGIINLDHCARL